MGMLGSARVRARGRDTIQKKRSALSHTHPYTHALHDGPELEVYGGVVDEGRELKAAVHADQVLVHGVHERRGLHDLVDDVHGLPAVVVWFGCG